MEQLLTPQNLLLLVGGAALFGTALTVGVFLLQRSLKRNVKSGKPRPQKIRVEDEAAFTLATIKSVVTQLKAEQKPLQDRLAAAERNTEETTRKFELLAREMQQGLITFDARGFISFSNPQVRTMLGIDTWSRRRFVEIFQDFPALADLIGSCFEAGTEARKKPMDYAGPGGSRRWVEVTVLPIRNGSGALESVICIFYQVKSTTPQT